MSPSEWLEIGRFDRIAPDSWKLWMELDPDNVDSEAAVGVDSMEAFLECYKNETIFEHFWDKEKHASEESLSSD